MVKLNYEQKKTLNETRCGRYYCYCRYPKTHKSKSTLGVMFSQIADQNYKMCVGVTLLLSNMLLNLNTHLNVYSEKLFIVSVV